MALLNKGLYFHKEQLRKAIEKFSTIKDIKLDELQDDQDWIDDDEAVLEEEEEDISDAEDDNVSAAISLPSAKNLEVNAQTCGKDSVWVWMFPDNISQSTIDGRNGSNACTVIALVFANLLNTYHLLLQPSNALPKQWMDVMVSSIRQGNALYDQSRGNLPHRYLSVAEAANVAKDCIYVNVARPLPVRIVDTHECSTLKNNIRQICLKSTNDENSYAIFIINELSFLFVGMRKNTLVLVDTHRHNAGGAGIVLGTLSNLDDFIEICKDFLHLDDTTFGNFVSLHFS